MRVMPILYNSRRKENIIWRLMKSQSPTDVNIKFIKDKRGYWSWLMDGDNHLVAESPYQISDILYARETWKGYMT